MIEKDMTLIEHIGELRKRLTILVVFFVLALIISFFLAQPLIQYLQYTEEAKNLTLNAFKITDPLKIFMQVTMILALIITSPLIMYQFWAFISPGLLDKERRATLSYIPFSVLLFLGGIAFAYLILFPYVIGFMLSISDNMDIQETIGINEYFQFLFQITLPFGLIFQLPVVMLFLTRLGIITPMLMTKYRKYSYLGLVIIAAFITPPDIVSHMIVTLPLIILYEFSVLIAKVGYRKFLKAEQQQAIKEQQESLPPK
ncbi:MULTISPECIES: twin-arginine translocase subunit TatC [Planococcus]|uniref:Sec-independent protein translocase protein TatC n=2 Tax=Planococcus TaxID=1372 RepID=A0ABN4K207_9BACL|nr:MULTISPECIES: twin-arginine translocase subunit TatC [Planococcus]ALS79714.1 preprotein translocase subunit TatC [Planococcus kocurii]AQU78300.1 twin arginine-targeting protein translocase TatC [Planococcus faecalis]KAA0955355.1 twin-arginine translocase subunit TatC [Planococcus sp. ANT_H30]MDJ0331891.1 twin-arginine translocase subunit TatC [Planococcus sp. S3-L1]OHX51314.1 twin arginine-targeting protein translocase TatC [Planococcus faecalis]